jgi:23S rRNA (uracil1939-C5)-methyltransferase
MSNYFKAKPKKNVNLPQVKLIIKRLDSNGVGVAELTVKPQDKRQQKPVFVAGALPNERIKAQLIEQKNKYAKAKLLEVIEPSKHRQDPKCAYFLSCGGCDIQHLSVEEQLEFKQQKVTELFNRQGITTELPWQTPVMSPPWHYRRKARIGVQYNKKGQAIVGFRRQGSNQLQAIKYCPVLVEPLSNIFAELNQVIAELKQSKSLGHIEVIYCQSTENAELITLVLRQLKTINKQDAHCWQTYIDQKNLATAQYWQILLDNGEEIIPLTTAKSLSFSPFNGINIRFESNDFIQVNNSINQKMVVQAINWLNLSENDQILDLFCGLGNFTLPIAQKVKQIIGVEGVQTMVQRAIQNAQANNINNVNFYQADLNNTWLEQPWGQHEYNKVILDPARAGALVAIEQVLTLNVDSILYVSCDPNTLANDSKILIDAGYRIIKIALLDMFTHTKHSETMVLFQRDN